jgi:hypothetical protein
MQNDQRDDTTGGPDSARNEEGSRQAAQTNGDGAARDDDRSRLTDASNPRKVDDLESSLRDGRGAEHGEVL